jgi:4-alpha-glucanotransferase
LHKKIDREKIVAEDLGIIDDGVRKLLKFTNYPGMKILSFAFNGDKNNPYLPKNIEENSVCFTGTHDNDTLLSLIKSLNPYEKNNFISLVKENMKEFSVKGRLDNDISLSKRVIELGFACPSKFFILPLFDLLLKDSEYRINEPGSVKEQNWGVKLSALGNMKKEKEYLLSLNKKYNRN